jgi:esterase/lipase
MDFKFKIIKIGKITGVYYTCGKKTDTILVWAIGGPTVPDNGDLSVAPIILEQGIDVFVPDYLGFGRSDGIFTPENCIKTLLFVYKSFDEGTYGISYYDDSKINLKYKKIIFVGKSLGGAYVPLLPKFNSKITNIAVFCGAVDQSEQGKIDGEETNEDFVRTIEKGGYKYLYRGFVENKKLWWKHLKDIDGLSPMDNIKYLKNAKVFIGHGKKDECIHYSKAENYYNKIIGKYPNRMSQFKLKLYLSGDHGKSTTLKAIRDFLDWIRI